LKLEEHEKFEIAKEIQDLIVIEVVQDRPDFHIDLKQLVVKLKTNQKDVYRKYINRPDFPKFKPDENGNLVFSDKEVDRWISLQHRKN